MAPDQLVVDVSYVTSLDDVILSSKEYHRPTKLKILAFFGAIWLLLLVASIVDRDAIEVVALVVITLMIAAVLAGASAISRRRYRKRLALRNEEVQVHFDDGRVGVHTTQSDSSFEWSALGQIRETKSFYFLGDWLGIPKRAFTSEQELAFRRLALRNLPLTKFRETE